MICLNCQKETNNPKYCSRTCAVSVNNKKLPKRKTKKKCIECETIVSNHRKNRCDYHLELFKSIDYKNKTAGEYRNMLSVKGKHLSWLNSHIRGFARSWLKHLTSLPCMHCGYDKHVEIAHIKAVSEFEDSALLSEINSEENVLILCPNCHWEFDNLPRK